MTGEIRATTPTPPPRRAGRWRGSPSPSRRASCWRPGSWRRGVATGARRRPARAPGVTVVVDFGSLGGGVVTQVRARATPTSGLAASTGRGLHLRLRAAVPRLRLPDQRLPNPVQRGPATAYWSYWHAPSARRWTYSASVPGAHNPHPNTVEGWAFGAGTSGRPLAAVADCRMTRLPRALHPGAWWLWALGLAAAASRTTNPLLLGADHRASPRWSWRPGARDAPWASRVPAATCEPGLFVVVMRGCCSGSSSAATAATTVLFTLPEIPLPDWAAGIQLRRAGHRRGGARRGLYDGLRLADDARSASARRTRWPTRSGCCGSCRPRCTRSAPPWSSRCRCAPQLVESVRAGAPGAAAARRPARGPRALRGIADAGPRRRARPLARAGRGDGLARLRPQRADVARRRPPADRRAAGRRAARRLRRRLRRARRRPRPRYLGLPMLLRRAGSSPRSGCALAGRRVPAHAATGRTRGGSPRRWSPPAGCVAAAVAGRDQLGVDPAGLYPSLYPLELAGAAAAAGRSAILIARAARRSLTPLPPVPRGGGALADRRDHAAPTAVAGTSDDPLRPGHRHATPARRTGRCATSTCAIDEGELCLVVGATGSASRRCCGRSTGWCRTSPAGTLSRPGHRRRPRHRGPPAARARRRRRRRRAGPAGRRSSPTRSRRSSPTRMEQLGDRAGT